MTVPAWKVIHNNYETIKSTSSKQQNVSHRWFRSRTTSREYYLQIDLYEPPASLILKTLNSLDLSESTPVSVHVIDDFHAEPCAWTPYMGPPFESEGIRTIDRKSLIFKHEIQPGVDVVELEHDGQTYVHKYMGPYSLHTSFTIEVVNYTKVKGSPYVPELIAIVTIDSENRGLLISKIEGDCLSDLILTTEEKWSVTSKLLNALEDLISRSYFPQDLKPENLMIHRSDQSIAIIDLGDGRTDYFYRDTSKAVKIEDRTRPPAGQFESKHAFYTIGRTLLAIWSGQYPGPDDGQLPENLPDVIRELIRRCCYTKRFETIQELIDAYNKDFPGL